MKQDETKQVADVPEDQCGGGEESQCCHCSQGDLVEVHCGPSGLIELLDAFFGQIPGYTETHSRTPLK